VLVTIFKIPAFDNRDTHGAEIIRFGDEQVG
jgi:hypothetical protein